MGSDRSSAELVAANDSLRNHRRRVVVQRILTDNGSADALSQVLGRLRLERFFTSITLAPISLVSRVRERALGPAHANVWPRASSLGLEDVLGLKVTQTDWMILSACQTAASDGAGEVLSGLVRAFFLAGAPSLLVSRCSVEDRATQSVIDSGRRC